MIVAIHQPDYFPYPGYFYKIMHSDCFVFLDDAQYSNQGFSNWNKIKTPQGELRLKFPVNQTLGDKICEVTSKDILGWKMKQIKIISANYKRAPYFGQIYPEIKMLIEKKYTNIAEMNIQIIKHIVNKFGFTGKFLCSSQMKIQTLKEQRVLDICSSLNANEYLSGNGAKAYQQEEHFIERGLQLRYTNYHPIEYPQLWGDFMPNLSILDYLFNCGYDWELIEHQINSSTEKDESNEINSSIEKDESYEIKK